MNFTENAHYDNQFSFTIGPVVCFVNQLECTFSKKL